MALTSSTPIELSDIQNEFDATSLVGASNAAGLSLPTGMLEFLGLSSSVTFTTAPASAFSPSGWVDLDSIENRFGFNPSIYAESEIGSSVGHISLIYNSNSSGFQTIPTNATVNYVKYGVVSSGCCFTGFGVANMADAFMWNRDFFAFQTSQAFLSGLSNEFASQSGQHLALLSEDTLSVSDFAYSPRTNPNATDNEKFISYWNSNAFNLFISGTNQFITSSIVKRNSNPDHVLRLYYATVEINYSL